MSEKENVEGEGFVIKDNRSSQISEDNAAFLDDQETKDQEKQTDISEKKVSLFRSIFLHL